LRLGPSGGLSAARVLLVDFSRSLRLSRLKGERYWARPRKIRAEAADAMRAIDTVAIARHVIITVVGGDARAFEKQYYDQITSTSDLESQMPRVRRKTAEQLLGFLRLKHTAAAVVASSAMRCRGACVALHLLGDDGQATRMADVSL
jgi:hypothetical protein